MTDATSQQLMHTPPQRLAEAGTEFPRLHADNHDAGQPTVDGSAWLTDACADSSTPSFGELSPALS
jgi:hypothetical protein